MDCWYAVHTRSCAERKSILNLENQGFETYFPHYTKVRRHARRVERVEAPLFPRYVFVRFDIEHTRWRAINGTFGVSYLICRGDRPAPVPDHLIARIRSREDAKGSVRLNKISPLNAGDEIRFISGPMMDHVGIFECERDEDRVVILLEILGRPMRISASVDAVVAVR